MASKAFSIPLLLVEAAFVAATAPVSAQDYGQPAAGESYVRDVVIARQLLMGQIGSFSAQLELAAADPEAFADAGEAAFALAASLAAFPHLFPAQSNLLGEATPLEDVATTADPRIWEDFESFYALAQNAAQLALDAAEAASPDELTALVGSLEQTCQSCHEAYVFFDPFGGF